jgi:hypothetical protein
MARLSGFWSYVHADDRAESKRISQLAKDLQQEYELQTGESVDLFLDRVTLQWGDKWREKIESSLATAGFFIPVLTPRYFLSAECRRELQVFARTATELGVRDLVLPLLYVRVPALEDEEVSDYLVDLVTDFQWVDWTDLRFTERHSEGYRRAVADLANRLVDANRRAEQADIPAAAAERERSSERRVETLGRFSPDVMERTRGVEEVPDQEGLAEEEAPGILDRLATAEEVLPQWNETLQAISREIQVVGQVMQEANEETQQSDAQGRGFAARLSIARRAANRLNEPAERVYSLGSQFATQLHTVDDAFRLIIESAPPETADNPQTRRGFCEFFRVVRNLHASAENGLTATQGMIEAIGTVEATSRDLRPPLRRFRLGLTIMLEARQVMDEWIRLIDETGIECDDDESND